MSLQKILGATPFGVLGKPSASKDFELRDQCKTNWCWAAVVISIADFRGKAVVDSQCQLVELALPSCGDCEDVDCNVPGDVVKAFKHEQIESAPGARAPSFPTIMSHVPKRPIVCRVQKQAHEKNSDTVPHAVVIADAFPENPPTVDVRDPSKEYKFYEKTWFYSNFSDLCIDHVLLDE